MSTKVAKPETTFEIVPEGTYIGRIYRFIHLGAYSGDSCHPIRCKAAT